jgi:hypothetical protein
LTLQWFKVPLNPVNADRKRVDQVEALGMLGQDRREHAWDNASELTWSRTIGIPVIHPTHL